MMPRVRLGLLTVGMAASVGAPAASQQPGAVSGRVFAGASGAPFVGAHVRIAGVEGGQRTDSSGRYVLPQVPAGLRQVEVTIADYGTVLRSVSVVPGDTSRLDFDLLPASVEPDLVLDGVAGGPARRREVGQSVAVVTGNELETAPVSTLTEALQGRLPGVLVLDASGWAGAGRQFQLRGAGSFSHTDRPRVLVDGVRVADLPYPLDPQSTQALDPLDDIDPATIDRVEVIRGPSAGSLFGREGANGVIRVFTRRGITGGPVWSFGADQGAAWLGHVGPGRTSNPDGLGLNDCRFAPGCPAGNTWLRTAHDQRYRATVSGGGRSVLAGYFVSGTWGREAGVISPQYSSAGSGRGNLTLRPLPSLEIAAGGAYARRRMRWIPGAFLTNVLSGSAMFAPGRNDSLFLLVNLDQRTTHATGALTVTWTPLTGLRHHLTSGLDRALARYRDDQPAGVPFPSVQAALRTEDFKVGALTADYAGSWDLTLGGVRSRLSWGAGLRKQTLDDSTRFESAGTFSMSALHRENTIRGFSVGERIGIRDRLFLTAGVRWDEASPWDSTGLEAFPAAALSYLMSESAFWPRWWESFQVRLALGRAGSPQRPMPLVPVFSPVAPTQPLRPERTRELEVGLQSSWLQGRLGLEYTYYAQHTSNVQALTQLPPVGGFLRSAVRNVGALSNQGHEARLSVSVLRGPGVTWDVGAHWSRNHSEASAVGPLVAITGGPSGGGVVQRIQDSLPVPSYYGLVVANPDEVGTVPVGEERPIGPVYPTFAYALTTRLSLAGRIVLVALGEGQGGHWLASATAYGSTRFGTWPECFDVQDQITVGEVSGLTAGQRAICDPRYASLAAWTLPAGFFRLRQASLTYRLPRGWVPGAHRAWLGVSARNLILLTNYRGLDPEAVTGGSTEGAFASGFRTESFELPHPRRVEVTVKVEW